MPYHIDGGGQFSYHAYNSGQWADVSGGLIFGYKFNKHLASHVSIAASGASPPRGDGMSGHVGARRSVTACG